MRRILLATAGSLALLAVALWSILPDLPDPVATHFGLTGMADRVDSRDTLWATTIVLPAVVAGLAAALTTTVGDNLPQGVRWIRGLPVGVVWGLGTVMLGTLLPQRGLTEATDATLSGVVVPLALGLGVAATLVSSRLASDSGPPSTAAMAPTGLPRADLPADGTAVWQGHTPTSRATLVVSVVLLVTAVTMAVLGWWVGLVLAAAALLPLASARFRVTIGPAGVHVAGWLGGWPRLMVPLETVAGASTSHLRALEFGGIGIRLKPGVPATAVVTASGPALDLARTDQSTVRITLADATEAAAVTNALLDRRTPRSEQR